MEKTDSFIVDRDDRANVKCWHASHFVFMAGIPMLIAGCGYMTNSQHEHRPVARAYGTYLYQENIAQLIPAGTTAPDSALIAKNFIESWIRQQVVLHKAEANLPDSSKQVDKQLEEYRNSLITFAYERELIRQQLDTAVSEEEIQRYYEGNPGNFELKDNIIKVLFARIRSDAPKIDEFRKWMRGGGTEENRALLEAYCHQYASDFILDDETWVAFDDLLKKVPLKTYDKEQFLRNTKYLELPDSNEINFLNIREYKIRESLSPLEFERKNIRDMILNKRKLALVRAMEKAAYEQAFRNNDFEIYGDEQQGE